MCVIPACEHLRILKDPKMGCVVPTQPRNFSLLRDVVQENYLFSIVDPSQLLLFIETNVSHSVWGGVFLLL